MKNDQSVGKSATEGKKASISAESDVRFRSAMYDALANRSRRLILEYLQDCSDHTASIEQLAEYVHEQSADTTASSRTTLRLHHVHLPKLEEMELLEYEHQNGVVRYQPNTTVEVLLNRAPEQRTQ